MNPNIEIEPKEEVIAASKCNFVVIKKTDESGKVRTVLKYEAEFDIENASVKDLAKGFKVFISELTKNEVDLSYKQ